MNENINSFTDALKDIDKIVDSLSSINDQMMILNETCSILTTNLEGINQIDFSDILGGIGDVLGIASGIVGIGTDWNEFTGIIDKFPKILSVFSSKLGLVIGGLGLAVGALTLFSNCETEAEKETRLFTEAQEEKRSELEETTKAINDSISSSLKKSEDIEAESLALSGYVEELKKLEEGNGISANLEEAQFYIDKINSAMPGTVELTKEGTLNWLKNSEAIAKNIRELEAKAKVEAYYDGYVESLKNEAKLRGELTLAQNNYNTELEKQQEYQAQFNELKAKYDEQGFLDEADLELMKQCTEGMQDSSIKVKEYSETLDQARGLYEANAKGAELYKGAIGALDGSVISSAELQLQEYTILEEDGSKTWKSLAAASEDCKNRIATAQGEEKAIIENTSKFVKDEMINKALVQGMTYDDMIKQLEDSGMQMSELEQEQLKQSYELWKMNSDDVCNVQSKGLDSLKLMKMTSLSNMNDKQKELLAESVKSFAENGDKSGIELCNKLAASLEANEGKINDETLNILNQIEKAAKTSQPKTKVNVVGPNSEDYQKINQEAKNGLKKQNIGVQIKPEGKGFSIFGHKINFDWWPFAEGGFPPTGELFLAREAGPELVGRINGKTAVANNDQIVSGISSGVFNAVRSAMQGSGNGNMNIHATFVMDGEVVGKQVIKYHNGVVKRTGTTPLMI